MSGKFPEHYEIVEGVLSPRPPLGVLGAMIAGELLIRMGEYARLRGLGLVLRRGLFPLRPGLSRRPVLAFLANDRIPPTEVLREDAENWPTPPNLAVEILSPAECWSDLVSRVPEYFAADVQRVWVVSPVNHEIHTFITPTRTHILTLDDELTADPVIPGFHCTVSDLFQLDFFKPVPNDNSR
jgi:Uma2 family endonuclease